ncbi:cysteine desulfurase [Sinobacterium caligoides]|uniref:Cysteine desulfurase n=1 Tax=Sinobacterium caligoides TaxID=933926 RepID=A0A3N2DZI6_9GAMM|nr:cysteine desulfurase [Sinobacterium caligoides]ROS05281.1 cysteine desulfurase [Sinobacterium caligoides]
MPHSTPNPWRHHFPLIDQPSCDVNRLSYLDSAATSQKPQCVIDAIEQYYRHYNANVHRAAHTLSARSTSAYEDCRDKVADFIGANESNEVIFTSGTTEGFNLLANTLPYVEGQRWQEGDEVILSTLEHHANIVPWQMLAERLGLVIKVIPLDCNGDLSIPHYQALLGPRTRLVSLTHVSNTLGTINPIKELTRLAHANSSLVAIDGAQACAHLDIDVQEIGCDFYLFSGHKMYAPTGSGILWGKYPLLNLLPPWQGGGEMIKTVSFEKVQYNQLPYRLEAGTPNISAIIGLGAAIDYLSSIDRQQVLRYEQKLCSSAKTQLADIEGINIIGEPKVQGSLFSFLIDGCEPSDIATLLDEQGVAVRSGHHCTQPLMTSLNLTGTVRASFALYNNEDDVNALVTAVHKACELLL